MRATTEPATITRPWRTVVWWDLAAETLRVEYPWSDAELDELRHAGVALPPPDDAIRARSRTWQRPILNAQRQLVLVVHDRDEGHHPLWSQLTSVAHGFNEIRIEDELLGQPERAEIPALEVRTEPLPLRPLPTPRRWWKLPADCRLEPRAAESYSSLQKLIDYPHEWVLTYPAKLATGRAANLPGLSLLFGNLAHRVFETYFDESPAVSRPRWLDRDDAAVRRWLAATLPGIIAREGAVLNEPGMGVRRDVVFATIENALLRLLDSLKQAGIVAVRAEEWHDVPFDGVAAGHEPLRLRGSIDLLLTDARGREVVLDVKWGGQDWRGRELADSRALQLATYAYMRRAAGGAAADWPELAYFVVTTGNIVARDTAVFPEALEFAPIDGASIDEVWGRICAAFDWRRAQLAAGDIECNAAGTEPDERSAPPEGALAVRGDFDRFDDFTWLTGWERGE